MEAAERLLANTGDLTTPKAQPAGDQREKLTLVCSLPNRVLVHNLAGALTTHGS